MPSRYLVAAVRAEYEQTTIFERVRKAGQELERRVVSPVEIVEDDRRRRRRGKGVECESHRLEERGGIALARCGRAELREQNRKLRRQFTDGCTRLGPA